MHSISSLAPSAQKKTRQDTCETHGAFEAVNYIGKIWSRCPKCAEVLAELRKKQEEEAERERQQRQWEYRLRRSCIPERFLDRTLKNFKAETPEQQRALAFASAYADDFDNVMKTGRCALFVGSPGTGKTHLAAGIALRLMHRGTPELEPDDENFVEGLGVYFIQTVARTANAAASGGGVDVPFSSASSALTQGSSKS